MTPKHRNCYRTIMYVFGYVDPLLKNICVMLLLPTQASPTTRTLERSTSFVRWPSVIPTDADIVQCLADWTARNLCTCPFRASPARPPPAPPCPAPTIPYGLGPSQKTPSVEPTWITSFVRAAGAAVHPCRLCCCLSPPCSLRHPPCPAPSRVSQMILQQKQAPRPPSCGLGAPLRLGWVAAGSASLAAPVRARPVTAAPAFHADPVIACP